MDGKREKRRQEASLILHGGTAITVDSERRVIRDVGIAVQGEEIVFVGKAQEVSDQFEAKQTLNCKDKVIIPGIINAHIHYSHQLSKGLSPDNLGTMLQSKYIHFNVSPYITEENEIWGAKAVLLEILKTGSTMFLEAGSYHPFKTIQSEIQHIGIKGMMGRRSFDLVSMGHDSLLESTDDILRDQEKFLREFHKEKLLIRPHVALVGMGRFSDRLVIEAKKIADRYGTLLNMHLANYLDSVNELRLRTGYRAVEHLEKLGVLDKNVVLVHMVHVNQKEVNILAKRGTKVVHCPSAALKIVHGLALGRFPEMLEAGIPVAIGSDASDCSNYHDMVRIMYLAAVLYKTIRHDPEIMGAEQAIEMATINGAKTLGMENEIGSLEVGKKADMVIFDANRLEWRPLYNEVQNLVYSSTGNSVESVIINGKLIVDKSKVLTINEEEILSEAHQIEKDLKTRLKIPTACSPWKFI
jgi:cytosine/adenosine deaminase-related metal-dependent hydrolase